MDKFDLEQFVDKLHADTASNNWRRLHGYPLRRKSANRRFKDQKKLLSLSKAGSGAGRTRYSIMPDLSKLQNK